MPDLRRLRQALQPLSRHPDPVVRQRIGDALRLLDDAPAHGELIPPHGNYRELASYQVSEIVFDCTAAFCKRFLSVKDRTYDQMVQAARSGKQNIAEGSSASGTSKKMELKLVSVARASLAELLEDYRDFLRTRGLREWGKNDSRSLEIRRLSKADNRSYATYASYVETEAPEVAANTAICLVCQTTYLLDCQLRSLEQAFLDGGGFTERLYRARRCRRDGEERP